MLGGEKMNSNAKVITLTSMLAIIITAFLLASKSYFNNQEIHLATNLCFESGGNPEVEMGILTLDYSFTCNSTE